MSLEQTKLPNKWVWASIEQLGEVVTGSTPQKKDPTFFGGYIPFYKPTDLDFGYEVVDAREYLSELGVSQSRLLPALSVLVTCIGATIGKTGLARRQCTTNQQINAVILPDNYLSPHWLFWAISSPQGQQMIIENASATTLPIINKGRFSELIFPIPPLNEQRRIVAKVEALKARSQQVKEALEAIPPLLEQFRQSVLAAAFRGDLTADWREKNPDVESAKELLKHIHNKRVERYELEIKAAKKQGKRKPQKPKQFELLDIQNWDIPFTWELAYPDDLCIPDGYSIGIGPFGSNLKVSDYRDEGVPIVFVRNIRSGNFAGLDSKYVSEEKAEELLPHIVKPLDLLITKMGDPPGDCEIYPSDRPEAIITSDCLKFRVWGDFLERKYFKHCINSVVIKKQLGLITRGVAQQKISLERFKSILIPVPSLAEQQEIVRRIELFLKTADTIEQQYREVKDHLELLDQTILTKAFRGELVPQDPNDEPASTLLERIRAERAKQEVAAKTAKKSTTKTIGKRRRKTQQQDSESVQLGLPGLE